MSHRVAVHTGRIAVPAEVRAGFRAEVDEHGRMLFNDACDDCDGWVVFISAADDFSVMAGNVFHDSDCPQLRTRSAR